MCEIKSLDIEGKRSYIDDRVCVPPLSFQLTRPDNMQEGVIVNGMYSDETLDDTFDLRQFKGSLQCLRLLPEMIACIGHTFLISQHRFIMGRWYQFIQLQVTISNEMRHLTGCQE